jgi:putative DNA primase/helicase
MDMKDAERKERAERKASTIPNDIVTEDSAAVQFVDQHGENLRYCHDTGGWYRWNVTHWERDKTGVAFHWARELARRLAENQDERKRYITHKTSFASGVEKYAKTDPKIAVTVDYWDADLWLIGTPGGTVDLRTGKLRDSNRQDGITKTTSIAPSDEGCQRWLQFLSETTGEDGELIRFLQQWCGYCLTGLTREHALVFVYGPGGNGKSVFLNVVNAIMKDYARTAGMATFTASKFDRHPTEIAMLNGARLVTASETEEGRPWAEARIKQLTGGDPITAHFMRQDDFTFTPQFKLTIVGNHKPVLHNVDDAARRRFNIVPFMRKPVRPDPDLERKLLLEEAGGILQWMIAGCLDWQLNGLIRPAAVQAATDAYFSDQDLFGQWIEDCCDVQLGNGRLWDKSSDLFDSWTDYAVKAGEPANSKKSFAQEMQRRGFEPHRQPGPGTRGFRFVRLKFAPQGYDA